jgi:hypothetical protein
VSAAVRRFERDAHNAVVDHAAAVGDAALED